MRILVLLRNPLREDDPEEVVIELSEGACRLMHATPGSIVSSIMRAMQFAYAGRAEVVHVSMLDELKH